MSVSISIFAQPPPSQHDTFTSSSSYGTYMEIQCDSSGTSLGFAGLSYPYANPVATSSPRLKQVDLEADAHLTSSPLSLLYSGSMARFDVSATDMPLHPSQMHPSPSKTAVISPGTGAKRQQGMPGQASAGSTPRLGGDNSKTCSFVSLSGNAVKKWPHRRYDEIEWLYQCSWPNCMKAYGALNCLNTRVNMQWHGPKRSHNVCALICHAISAYTESKELQKKRQEKEAQAEREREQETAAEAMSMGDVQYHHLHQMVDDGHHINSRWRMVEPYLDPHGHRPSGGPHTLPNTAMQGPGRRALAWAWMRGTAYRLQRTRRLTSAIPLLDTTCRKASHRLVSLSITPRRQMTPQGELVGPGLGNQHPLQHPQHGMRAPRQQQFYGAQSNITLPPPHSLNSLSVSAPNPSPLSGGFPSLGPSTGPGPTLRGDVGLSMAGAIGAGQESGSPTPKLAAHVSLGSNRLPPDSTLLTPLPGYEPESNQMDIGRPRDRSRECDLEWDYDRECAWGRDCEQYYARNGQETGREQQYE